jgi:quercetin dioxygenase-like cupin family protein
MRVAAATVTALGLFTVTFAHADDMGINRKLAENKFATLPGTPTCVTAAVESGDPTKGPSVIVFKASSGCKIPWHWHTPAEHLMMVSGSAKMEMKDGGTAVLGAGGYSMLPSKHVHQFTCTTSCTAFVVSDAAFDIHYVDADGKEITPDAALAAKKKK